MTNLLLFVALEAIIGLIIILAKTFKEKNVLKEDLKCAYDTISRKCAYEEQYYQEIVMHKKENEALKTTNQSLAVTIESLQSESDGLNARHTEYLQTMQELADENNRLKQHIEQLTTPIPVNKIETKSKKNRRV